MDVNEQLLHVSDIDSRYELLLMALELNGVSTMDLIIYQSSNNLGQLLKRIGRSVREIQEFIEVINGSIKEDIGPKSIEDQSVIDKIPTGLEQLDKHLHGGIRLGEITEIFGSSGCGKSQFLYQIAGKSQLSSRNKVIIINTEKFLETNRLAEIITDNFHSNDADKSQENISSKLDNIDYYYCNDLETQDHILYSQLPIKLQLDNKIRTIIIDSIGHHLRQDEIVSITGFLKSKINEQNNDSEVKQLDFFQTNRKKQEQQYDKFFKSNRYYELSISRKAYLLTLYRHLKTLCVKYNVAVVVSNQISDQMSNFDPNIYFPSNDPLDLDYQIGGISGWDNKTTWNYQKQFSSIPLSSMLNTPDTYDDTTTDLPYEINRVLRTKMPQNADTSLEENDSTTDSVPRNNYQIINTMVNNFHRSSNINTKTQVPSLGYHWSKLLTNRILLMKTYRPVVDATVDYDQLHQSQQEEVDPEITDNSDTNYGDYPEHNSNSDHIYDEHGDHRQGHTKKKRKLSPEIPIHSFINSWSVERYLKVTSCPFDHKIKFELTKAGLVG